ncbi:MAG: disulfide bond formation protein B [Acetobacteraceae bacterium]
MIGYAIALAAGAGTVGGLGSEGWLGSPPRLPLLVQRWPYWGAAGLALLAALWGGMAGRVALLLAGVSVLGSGGIAALHLGVEWGWWPSPLPGCVAPALPAGASVEEMLRALPAAPTVPCDEPVFPLAPLPLSFAALNLIYAAALGAVTLRAALRRPT